MYPAREDRDRQQRAEDHQHRPLDELHPRCADHAGRHDDHDYDAADDGDADLVTPAQQRLDDRTRADHLRHQIKEAHDQRADASGQRNALALEAAVERIRERELPQPLDGLGDHEQRDHPPGQVSDRVEESVVAVKRDESADPQERRG
jgi:hypothetical protein